MPESYNIKVKVCLVGDSQVGKTSLVRRYVIDIFDDGYIATIGTKISKKRIILNKMGMKINLTFSIWDVLGQDEFKNIFNMAIKGAKGAIVVCDITRKDTLNNVTSWLSRIKAVTGEIPVVVLANKCDLTNDYAFDEKNLRTFLQELKIPCFLTSAKFGDNVIKSFFHLGELITDNLFIINKPNIISTPVSSQ